MSNSVRLRLTTERLEERAVPASLQVIHNSPFESAAVVDVQINGDTAIDDFAFQTATPFLDVTTLDNDPATDGIQLDIRITTADGMTEVFATPVSLDTGVDYVAAAVGEPFNDFGLSVFAPAQTTGSMAGNTDLLVLHGSPDAPTVDIVARDVATLVDDLSFTEFSDAYVSVPTDNYVIDVTTEDGATGLFSFDVPLAELGLDGAALTVAASGFADPSPDQPGFSLLAVLPNGDTLVIEPQVTQLQVIHNSPFASASVVDVLVNGATVLDDFAFQDASPFLDVTALDNDSNLLNGVQLDISVTTADGTTEVFTTSVDLETGVDYVAAAVGEPFNDFGLSVFAPAQTTGSMAGNTDLLVLHGSPDAPTVDIVARDVATLVDDLSFTEFSDAYVSVPTADYVIDVTSADGNTTLFSFDVPLQTLGLQDQALTVAASGFAAPSADQPGFSLLAVLPNGDTVVIQPTVDQSEPTQLQVIHNSPFASASVVDVLVNGATVLDDFAFRNASPFLDVAPFDLDPQTDGIQLDISITTADGATEVFATSVTLDEGGNFIAAAVGEPFNDFGLSVFASAQTAGVTGNTSLLVMHGSPDAPTVDIVARDVATLVDDLSFTEFADDYVSVPTAAYTIDVTLADGRTRVFTFEVDLAALGLDGQALTVFASGFALPQEDQPNFGLLAALPNGDTAVIEPEATASIEGTDGQDQFTVRLSGSNENIVQLFTPTGTIQYFVPTAPEINLSGLNGSDRLNIYLPSATATLPTLTFDGGADSDQIYIFASNQDDVIIANEDTSVVALSLNGNTVSATGLEDMLIFANNGNDQIDLSGLSSFGVFVSGGDGNDTIATGAGDDVIFGDNGDDMIMAGDGNDLLMGGAGNDDLFGEDGDDVLFGGPGSNNLDGGSGRNITF